jgi:hypothetical protein
MSNEQLLKLNSVVVRLFSELAVGTQPVWVTPTMTDALCKLWKLAYCELISRCYGDTAADIQNCMAEHLDGMPWHDPSPSSKSDRHNCSGKGAEVLQWEWAVST